MKIELLAPAGNLEKLKIAIQYGADAVYIAGQQFGLRSAADNFSEFEIAEAIQFAHQHQRKIYLTLNGYLHDPDIQALPRFLECLNPLKPDGVICSDLGVVKTIRRYSSIPIHVSTQASVLNSHHATIWKKAGARRVVVGRELTLSEAAELKQRTGMEVEVFIHGAMCMSYSGHCTISNYTAGRDSNRGGCIQSCRFNYDLYPQTGDSKKAYFMSSKDLCGIAQLKQFLRYGIDSIKIEGRMKSNLYIASTVRVYRQALDHLAQTDDINFGQMIGELRKIPHRDYTEGSLASLAGISSVYDKQGELCHDYEMAGTVLLIDQEHRRFAFQAKNKLHAGDKIEVLSFHGDIETIEIDQLVNMSENIIQVAQPSNMIWLKWRDGIEAHNVARILKQ